MNVSDIKTVIATAIFACLAILMAIFVRGFIYDNAEYLFDNIVEQQVVAQEQIDSGGIKILIVPGHTEFHPGAQVTIEGGEVTTEAHLARHAATRLTNLLKKDKNFNPILLSDDLGDHPLFSEFYIQNLDRIKRVQNSSESIPDELSLRLHGINLWVNEELQPELILHMHFNDYDGRPNYEMGTQEGFVLHVPQWGMRHGKESQIFAEKLHEKLSIVSIPSTAPDEEGGLLQDKGMVALGSGGTLKAPSIVIEYGYVYEPQFTHVSVRDHMMHELAFQTYQAIQAHFNDTISLGIQTSLLPHVWQLDVRYGEEPHVDVLALQALLRLQRLYPVAGMEARECRLNGILNPCTITALKQFQSLRGLSVTGKIDTSTREVLNTMFDF